MTLARRFNAGITVNNRGLVASATTEDINRRYATRGGNGASMIPALKRRAKFTRRSATKSRLRLDA